MPEHVDCVSLSQNNESDNVNSPTIEAQAATITEDTSPFATEEQTVTEQEEQIASIVNVTTPTIAEAEAPILIVSDGAQVIPVTEATVVVSQATDVEAGNQANDVTASRAEFITVSFLKKKVEDKLCVGMTPDVDGNVIVSELSRELSEYSSLNVGDRVFSINGVMCRGMVEKDLEKFKKLVGIVAIVVHNPGCRPNLSETLIEKPDRDATVGLGMCLTNSGTLEISKVSPNGMYARSLLNIGDRVLSINSVLCNGMQPRDALDIVRRSEQYVSIMTESQGGAGMVVAVADGSGDDQSYISLRASRRILEDELSSARNNACFCIWMITLSLLLVCLATWFWE